MFVVGQPVAVVPFKGRFRAELVGAFFCELVPFWTCCELVELVPALRFLDACCAGGAEAAGIDDDDDDDATVDEMRFCWFASLIVAAGLLPSVEGRGLRVEDAAGRSGATSLRALGAMRVAFFGSASSFLSGYISKSITSRSLSSA